MKDATGKQMAAFWNVASCVLVDIHRRFGGAYCLHHQGDEFSVTPASIYQTTSCSVPEDSHLLNRRRENLKMEMLLLPG
jgi:hypothetical protein